MGCSCLQLQSCVCWGLSSTCLRLRCIWVMGAVFMFDVPSASVCECWGLSSTCLRLLTLCAVSPRCFWPEVLGAVFMFDVPSASVCACWGLSSTCLRLQCIWVLGAVFMF